MLKVTNNIMLTEQEIREIADLGKSEQEIQKQIEKLKNGFPTLTALSPAIVGDGIAILTNEECLKYAGSYEMADLEVVKFVPASGAASRMFKSLNTAIINNEESDEIKLFVASINKFAFSNLVSSELSSIEIANYVLEKEGLNYRSLPKGLIQFHKYDNKPRTPFEEHLFEACLYGSNNGLAKVHFTISKDHAYIIQALVEGCIDNLKSIFNISVEIEYSNQMSTTDTVALDEKGSLMRVDGEISFRPAGHGALIKNLNNINADIIFVKNIDNVVKESLIGDTVLYKKALAGKLIELINKIHLLLDCLLKEPSEEVLNNSVHFIKTELGVDLVLEAKNLESKIHLVYRYLNRPVRVAGMVKNGGEPGGGPFWVKDNKYGKSLQIVEEVQINKEDPEQRSILEASTHFNPVDLVCYVKNHKGDKFDLLKYVDQDAGLIADKSLEGKSIKILELPGLWNGAMADWITLFVEVPVTTFNPVKTVFDLLKPSHQAD
jgi:hypothetical protein